MINRYINSIAGTFILISLALAHFVNPNWIWFTVFVGANLLQSGITNWCLMSVILKKMGVSLSNPILRFITWLTIFLSITTSLIFFRSPNILHALLYIKNMFSVHSTLVNVTYDRTELILSFMLILMVQVIHYFKGNDRIPELVLRRPPVMRWGFYLAFILVIVLLSVNRQNNFIYFQF